MKGTSKTIRHRVNAKKKLVCLYHSGLGMYEVFKITNQGGMNKQYASRVAFTSNWSEAMKHMQVAMAGFKVVHVFKQTATTWHGLALQVWNQYQRQAA